MICEISVGFALSVDMTYEVGSHYLVVFAGQNTHFKERRGGAHPQNAYALGFTTKKDEESYRWMGVHLAEIIFKQIGTL